MRSVNPLKGVLQLRNTDQLWCVFYHCFLLEGSSLLQCWNFYIAKRWAGQDSTQAITHFPLKSKFTSWKVKKSILPNVGTTGQFWALLESSFGPKRIKRKMCIKYNQMIKVTNQQWFSMFKMTSSHHSSIYQFAIFEYWESCQVHVGMINMCVWWCNQICHFGK